MQHSFLAGLFAALAAVLMWGLQLPIAKDVFAVIDPFHTTALRYLIATAVLLPIFVHREGWAGLRYHGSGPRFALIGVMGMSASPLCVFYGISLAGAERGSVIVALQPSVMALTQWLWLRKRPSNFTLSCMGIAFAGVIAVVTRGHSLAMTAPREILGCVLVLMGGAFWVAYSLGVEHLPRWSTWRITILTMIPGTAASVLITAMLVRLGYIEMPTFEAIRIVWWQLTFLGLLGVVVGMLAWNYGIQRIGPLNATLLTNLMPVITFTYRALQGHVFLPIEIIGATVVVIALIANNLNLRRQHMRTKPGDLAPKGAGT